jgi:hypothetical protein
MDCENDLKLLAESENRTEVIGRRKPYKSPRLEVLGDVRDITLGGSPGVGDSGGTGAVQRHP